ncbi:TniA putative transposase [Paramagnetospirillum magnetotacticum MS-1]|uniref:TniA putative transposase n=1 Tax=Paramagnetospirillum magnetotacticum MS-1 TaxID=272627 RepID=A0A0C2YZP3_PARME|nr:DDE-type integrase/transposase/recombinase [Paramagnetospirillum magnetotacticum]KIM00559.1 TniA putative transposase [Paramagnetospirillum magnetotacticum MS-1]
MTSPKMKLGKRLKYRGVLYTVERRLDVEIELRNPTGRIEYVSDESLLKALYEEQLDLNPSDEHAGGQATSPLRFEHLSENDKHKMFRNWKIGQAILAAEELGKLNPQTMKQLAAAVISQNGWHDPVPSQSSLYRLASQARKSDGASLALAPNTHRKGNRIPKLSPEVKKIIDDAIKEKYKTMNRLTIQDVHREVLYLISKYNEDPLHETKQPLPSYSSVKTAINNMNQYDLQKSRFGRAKARQHHGIFGPGITATRTNEIWQIDHTPINILLVNEKCQFIGQPTITVSVDVYSKAITGFYIGFEPPSYHSVARCLEHAIRPKDYIENKYIDVKCKWPVFGIPERIMCDNGREFHSIAFEQSCSALGIHIDYAGVRSPWTKGIIENVMKLVNHSFSHKLYGTTFSNYIDRGDYNAADAAVIGYDEFVSVFHKFVVDIELNEPHRTTMETPLSRWLNGTETHPIRPATKIDSLRFHLNKPAGTRKVHHYGISFKGLTYSCNGLEAIRSLHHKKHVVSVTYDPSALRSIFVTHRQLAEPLEVPCTDQEYTNNLSEYAHRICLNYVRKNFKNEMNNSNLLAARHDISRIIDRDTNKKSIRSRKKIVRFGNHDAASHHGLSPTPSQVAELPKSRNAPTNGLDDDLDIPDLTTSTMPTGPRQK